MISRVKILRTSLKVCSALIGISQFTSIEFGGDRPYLKLLLEELWYASSEFPGFRGEGHHAKLPGPLCRLQPRPAKIFQEVWLSRW